MVFIQLVALAVGNTTGNIIGTIPLDTSAEAFVLGTHFAKYCENTKIFHAQTAVCNIRIT